MKNKVAFICPLYDMKNHFDLAYNLFKSKVEFNIAADLWFVFTNKEHKDKFSIRVESLNQELKYLILPVALDKYKSKITVKKMFALEQLMAEYDYLAAIDSESLFIRSVDYNTVFDEIWKNQSGLNSNISTDGFHILHRCYEAIGLLEDKTLKQEFENYKYNFWFNEIPVYKCDTLPDFFRWMSNFPIEKWGNEWCCFEYYLYVAFLLKEKNFHLRRYKYYSFYGIMEDMTLFSRKKQLEIISKFQTHWTSNKEVLNDGICMLFHLDRSGGGYGSLSALLKRKIIFLLKYWVLVLNIYPPECQVNQCYSSSSGKYNNHTHKVTK